MLLQMFIVLIMMFSNTSELLSFYIFIVNTKQKNLLPIKGALSNMIIKYNVMELFKYLE